MQQFWRTAAVLGLVGVLAACSSAGTAGSDAGYAPEVSVEDAPRDSAAGTGTDAAADRQVVVTGSMTVVTDDPLAAADEATDVVESAGGRVDSRSEAAGDETSLPSASLVVRIPADRLTETLERLGEIGVVEDLALDRQDVTLQVTDLDARIGALQASIDRLQALISQATTTADLLEAENALTARQAELDSLTAQRAYLAEQVDLSTISISLLPEEAAPAPAPGGFWGGVTAGWNALVTAFNAVVVLLGMLLPWLLVAGVVTGVVLLVRRLVPHKPRPPRPPAGPWPGGGMPPAPTGAYAPPPAAPPRQEQPRQEPPRS